MKELTIKEMEIISGGVVQLIPVIARGIMQLASSSVGRNAIAGAGGYVAYSHLSGNKPTVSGALASGTVGGTLGLLGKTTVGLTIGAPAATGALEGGFNGKSPLFNKSQDKSGNDYGNH